MCALAHDAIPFVTDESIAIKDGRASWVLPVGPGREPCWRR
jgi:hypothetical protein